MELNPTPSLSSSSFAADESSLEMGRNLILTASVSALNREFLRLVSSGLESINASKFIRRAVKIEKTDEKEFLSICSNEFSSNASSQSRTNRFELKNNVYVAAFGKAALSMSVEIEHLMNRHLVRGVAIVPYSEGEKYESTDENSQDLKEIYPVQNSKISYFYGARDNLPDILAVNATKRTLDMCEHLSESDILLALISGGGSALLTQPIDLTQNSGENLKLKLATIKSLVKSGADINELNTVRSCLSRVKSGNLALLSRRATIISLIISDVINDPLEIISSGPTCPSFFTLTNQDRIGNAMSIIHKYRLENEIPQTVMNFFIKQQQKEESSKHSSSPLVYNYLIFNNRQATDMIMSEANSIGYDYKKVLTNSLCGEAKIVGFAFACLAYSLALGRNYIDIPNLIEFVRKLLFDNEEYSKLMDSNELKQCMDTLEILLSKVQDLKEDIKDAEKMRICLIAGGETTVNLKNVDSGVLERSKGGRNQEMTLAFELLFGELMSRFEGDVDLLFSSFGSDGIDGPTDAAGAYFEYTASENRQPTSLLTSYLDSHNSYNYFAKQNRLLKTGPTGTNVSDLQILILQF